MKLKSINKNMMLSAITLTVIAATIILLFSFINREFDTLECRGVEISIDYNGSECILRTEDIKKYLTSRIDTFEGKTIGSLGIDILEDMLRANPFVEEANIYASLNGIINTKVKQRRPIARIYTSPGNSFYIDRLGIVMPTWQGRPARVLIINGNISTSIVPGVSVLETIGGNEEYRHVFLREIFLLADFISRDELLKAQIDQLYVKNKNAILMVPKLGNHLIEFGDPGNYEWKFKKLLSLYKEGFGLADWNAYERICLKYENQVVCTKR